MSEQMRLQEQLCFITIRIQCPAQEGEWALGTGFFVNFPYAGGVIPVIVTNKHVLGNADHAFFFLTHAADGMPQVGRFAEIRYDGLQGLIIPHPDPCVDVCAVPAGPLFNSARSQGKEFFYRCFARDMIATPAEMTEFAPLDPIAMVGYPAGIWDEVNNMPVFRRGVTASRPDLDYNGQKKFMVDVPTVRGSSGSPVLSVETGPKLTDNRQIMFGRATCKLLGILAEYVVLKTDGQLEARAIPTVPSLTEAIQVPISLGVAVKAHTILELEGALLKMAGERS